MRAAATALLPAFRAEEHLRRSGTKGLSAIGAYKLVLLATGDSAAAKRAFAAKIEEGYDR